MFDHMDSVSIFRFSSEIRQAAHYAHKAWVLAFPVNRQLAADIHEHIIELTELADAAHEEMCVRGYLDAPEVPVQP